MTKVDKAMDGGLRNFKDSEVLKILKRRIYHGKAHDTKLSDLQTASREILDWCDKKLESPIPSQKQALIKEILEEAKTYSNVTYDFGTAMVVNEVKAVPIATIKEIGKQL